MRPPGAVDAIADSARRIGRDGLIVRSLVVLATAGCWATATAVGRLSWPATVVLVIVAFAAVSAPDSGAPLLLIAVLTVSWMLEVRPLSLGWSLVLAVAVLVIHAASARAAALGDGGALDGRVARRWLAQTAAVAAVTTGLWAGLLLLDDAALGGAQAVSAAAIAAVAAFAVLGASAAGIRRPD